MRRIAVLNQKGGVGKTTTTANLGAAIAEAGRRVLMIDLDPQAHLTLHYGVEPAAVEVGAYEVLTQSAPLSNAMVEVRERIQLVAAHTDLVACESELVSVVGREVILRDALDAVVGKTADASGSGLPSGSEAGSGTGNGSDRVHGLSQSGAFDVLLIDCPPSLGVLTLNALSAVDEVFIPLQPHFLALQGLAKLLETVSLVQARINPSLQVTGIVLCMYEAGTKLAAEISDELRSFIERAHDQNLPWSHARLFDTVIRRNIKLAESPSYGQTIFDYAPKSNGALDYAGLAGEVLGVAVSDPVADHVPAKEQGVSVPQDAASPDAAAEQVASEAEAPVATTSPTTLPTTATANEEGPSPSQVAETARPVDESAADTPTETVVESVADAEAIEPVAPADLPVDHEPVARLTKIA